MGGMQPRHHTLASGFALAGALAVLASGCGGSNNNDNSSSSAPAKPKTTAKAPAASSGAKGTSLALAADPSGKIAYDKKTLTGKAGTNTINFTNASQVPHAVEVEGKGVEKETKTIQGGKASLTLNLKPGTYEFYCPVDDHKAEGMKGTLTVK
jgi:plastocyanin